MLRENGGGSGQTLLPQTKESARREIATLKNISDHRYDEKIMTGQAQRRQSLKIPTPISRPPTQELRTFAQTSTNKHSNLPDKLLDMGKLYLNEKGVDSAPTNFNKRTTSTSQNHRVSYSRGASQEMDRNAITAKFSRRGWMGK